ncbi:MAG: Ig-like domain-containing protein [Deltaproteobacteria bacterium]|nr:Ig-like domain-containing protein [Deltaproteobacteria bacterium]
MQDPEAVLPVTVTNNSGSTRDIREIEFNVDTAKYSFSASTVPPPGWCVTSFTAGTIIFALTQSSGICGTGSTSAEVSPGESLTFNITALPSAASADVAGDTFTSVRVLTQSNFSRAGAMPAWTRRSIEALLSAAPSSVGAGETITLSMQATNRSTATQTTINSAPSPPTASSAIVTNTAGPFFGSTALNGDHADSATIINVGSTAEFPSTGTIRVGGEDICYSAKTATSFSGITRGCNGTTAATHVSGSVVYGLTAFSLLPGETGTVFWEYAANSSGQVYFTARAANGASTAKSTTVNSNIVLIGDFTASLAITPVSVISGQVITVEMLAVNNGTTALIDIAPSALTPCGGGATETFVSGPSPASVSSLAPKGSGVFYWTYRVTGSIGQAYCLSGSALAGGPVTTDPVTSNTGTISQYSATVAPATIASGSVNETFTWTVFNGGACAIKEVDIATPASGGDWNCSSVAPPSGWSASCANTVRFRSNSSANDIPSGGSKSFSITFSTTESVSSDKTAAFPVTPVPRTGCGGAEGTIGSYVTVTAYGAALFHSPAGPIYADGSSAYTVTATLTSGGNPVSGKTVTFSTTNGSLSSSTALTGVNGQATVSLMAPNSAVDTTAVVTAAHVNASASDTVNFTGWTKANLQYWGGLSPAAAVCGGSYSFTVSVRDISASVPMSLTTSSYFSFNDSSAGGGAVYKAYLDSPVTVSSSSTRTLTFGSPTSAGGGGGVKVSSSFLEGTFMPAANSTPPPESGVFFTDGGTNDQYRAVTDNITVSGDCGAVSVIEWHEMR